MFPSEARLDTLVRLALEGDESAESLLYAAASEAETPSELSLAMAYVIEFEEVRESLRADEEEMWAGF